MGATLKKPSGAEICGNDGSIDGAKSTIEHRGLARQSTPVERRERRRDGIAFTSHGYA